jgi:hypothetical protein
MIFASISPKLFNTYNQVVSGSSPWWTYLIVNLLCIKNNKCFFYLQTICKQNDPKMAQIVVSNATFLQSSVE